MPSATTATTVGRPARRDGAHDRPDRRPDGRAGTRTLPAPGGPAHRYAWRPVLVVVAVKVGLNLIASPRYGWHRDELYYADAGRHLDWGFVDFPPVTPLLAAAARAVSGDSLVGLRSIASLAGVVTILVTAAVARELGGGRRAQGLAAVAITPLVVGTNAMFQTVSFDQAAWALVIWAATALVRRGPTTARWCWLGAAAALAWQTKWTAGVLLVGLAVGWLSTRSGRATLRGPGPLLAVGILAVTAVPNLLWQVSHGWPSVAFFAGRSGEVRGDNPPWRFVLELGFILGPVAVPVAVVGVRHLLRDAATRPVGLALALVAPTILVAGGKSYYAAPLAVGTFAAGAVAWEQRVRPSRSARLPAAIAASALVAAPVVAPFLPTDAMLDRGLHHVREDYAAELGWPELAAQVEVAAAVHGDTVVLAGSYGVAGAVERFGSGRLEVVSGDLQWQHWSVSPGAASVSTVLLAGFSEVDGLCATPPERVGTVSDPPRVETVEGGRGLWHCTLAEPLLATRAALAVP